VAVMPDGPMSGRLETGPETYRPNGGFGMWLVPKYPEWVKSTGRKLGADHY
jgi:hypothetical protein